MPNGIFTGSLTLGTDGSTHFELQSLRVKATKRFTPAQLLPLKAWLASANDWDLAPARPSGLRVSYSHDDGKIRLETQSGVQYYDPLNDEDLARFVRHLKARAPVPHSDQPQLPGLPTVTDEDLRTKRTVYTAAQAAGGVKKPKQRKPSVPTKPSVSEAQLDALLNQMLAAV